MILKKQRPQRVCPYLPESNGWFFTLLSKRSSYFDPVLRTEIPTQPVFSVPAALPEMPWKSNPVKGSLMGNVVSQNGQPYDHLKVTIEASLTVYPDTSNSSAGCVRFHREVYTDGSGWFGLTELPPGFYRLTVNLPPAQPSLQTLTPEPNQTLTGMTDQGLAKTRMKEVAVQAGRVTEVEF
jgi:hypothetical protein